MRPCGCLVNGPHRNICKVGQPNTAPSLAQLKRQWMARDVELPSVDWMPKERFAIRKKRVAQTNSS